MRAWFDEQVVAPANELLLSIPIRGEVRDLERCDALAIGIDFLFMDEVEAQYAGWPRGFTTDGTVIESCVRSREDTIEVAGMTWLDFTGSLFPSRAEVRRTPDNSASVTAYIGNVDPRTGEPPRMPPGTVVLPVRSEDEALPVPELLLGRRQVSIVWTKAFEVR